MSVEDRVAIATRTAAGAWDEMTYGQLDRRAGEVAAALADGGVEAGDRVALIGPPGGEWTASFLGIRRHGAVAVPLDTKLTVGERAALCERSGLAATIELSARLVAQTRNGAEKSRSEAAVLVWTSGTTGEPKGVMLSQGNLDYVVEQASAIQGTDSQARWLSVLPPNHLLELCCGLLPGLAAESTTFVAGTIVPHELVTMMTECRVNQMVVVPLVLRLLKRHLEGTGAELPGVLRAFYCGGAPLDPEIATFFEDRGVGVFQGYGLTETASAVAMNSPGHNRLGSVGRPLPGTEIKTAPDDGEIVVRGPGVMLGYWNDEAATRETVDADGWLHTGDLGRLDEDGFLYVTGRAKTLIVLDSGKKVQPEEVETALARSRLFAEVAVVGLPGPTGEQACAVVVPSGPMSEEAAEDEVLRLTAGLAAYKRPTVVRVVHEELPKTVKRSLRRADIVKLIAR